MKNKLYISLLAASALAFNSCESDINNFMVDDTVGLLNSGLVTTEVYLGVDDPTKVYAIKAGKGFQDAQVSIKVDNSVLTEYNELSTTAVKLDELPADCYSITVSSVTLTSDDYRVPFEISWNRDRLSEVLAQNPNVGLPLRMIVDSDAAIATDRLTTIIKPTLETPYVSFDMSKLDKNGVFKAVSPTRDQVYESELYFKVTSNFIAQRDIEYTLEIDETLIAEYNEANGTAYKLLPAEAYKLELTGNEIKQYLSEDMFKMYFYRSALVPDNAPSNFGDFMLPIRIKSVSSSYVDPVNCKLLYAVSVVPMTVEKSKWSIVECNSDVNDDPESTDSEKANNGADALIDGTTSKWWRSIYRTAQDLPYYAVIDLGRKTAVAKVGFEIPASSNKRYANSKAGHVEVSEDGTTWVNVGTWESPSAATQSVVADVTPTTARYLKFVIDEVFKDASSGSIKNPNATAIGEINVWGEVATWEEDTEE
ncbi:MAG: DUF1735 domain-containing protein [Muribaculaceae bacterium]|nr:DUF1735 domain-containing protein [Muribaculaceae bacterium]